MFAFVLVSAASKLAGVAGSIAANMPNDVTKHSLYPPNYGSGFMKS